MLRELGLELVPQHERGRKLLEVEGKKYEYNSSTFALLAVSLAEFVRFVYIYVLINVRAMLMDTRSTRGKEKVDAVSFEDGLPSSRACRESLRVISV